MFSALVPVIPLTLTIGDTLKHTSRLRDGCGIHSDFG